MKLADPTQNGVNIREEEIDGYRRLKDVERNSQGKFECDRCDKSYNQKCSLYCHVRLYHG